MFNGYIVSKFDKLPSNNLGVFAVNTQFFLLFASNLTTIFIRHVVVSTLRWPVTVMPQIFTARRYAKRAICRRRVSVCVCVCLSHSGIVSKRLNVGSRK